MTRTIFRSPTGDARDTGRRVILPVMRGVVSIGFPRTTAAHAVYNWCDGQSAYTVNGTLTYSAGYFSGSGATDRLDTALYETEAMSYYIVLKSSSAFSSSTTRPTPIGVYQSQSGGLAGACIQVTGTPSAAPAANVTMYAARDVAGTPTLLGATVAVTSLSTWTLLVGCCDATLTTSARRIYDKTNGNSAVASSAQATSRVLNSTTVVRVGAVTGASYGQFDIAAHVVANVAHTADEIEKNAIAIRRRLAAFHSITV